MLDTNNLKNNNKAEYNFTFSMETKNEYLKQMEGI